VGRHGRRGEVRSSNSPADQPIPCGNAPAADSGLRGLAGWLHGWQLHDINTPSQQPSPLRPHTAPKLHNGLTPWKEGHATRRPQYVPASAPPIAHRHVPLYLYATMQPLSYKVTCTDTLQLCPTQSRPRTSRMATCRVGACCPCLCRHADPLVRHNGKHAAHGCGRYLSLRLRCTADI
jgi:hypothetical protein